MAKKRKLEVSQPSKAYLVSFGDTMTALLAFFIVINSLAKEQTGAAMYSGTGSFVRSFANSGMPGSKPGDRSSDMIQQKQQRPIYALAKNRHKNEERRGVSDDETDQRERVVDRERDDFQRFLVDIEKRFGLETRPENIDQVAFDSFERFDRETNELSKHALRLISDAMNRVRQPNTSMEIIVWANMPSPASLKTQLDRTVEIRKQIESKFRISPEVHDRIHYRAKPWLFSDAKRPVLTVVLSTLEDSSKAEP